MAQIVFYPIITDEDKQKRKDQLELRRKQIISGERTFEGVATLESDDPGSRLQGGNLGWNSRGTMVPEFEAELFKLEKNGISPVFETQYGYHIVQLIEGDMTGLKFIIPQKGTSMDVYLSINSNELEFPIITLSWDKKKFNISKKHSNIPGI